MTTPVNPSPAARPAGATRTGSLFTLSYPQSVAIFDTYAEAAKAVDYLADEQFPVENLAIVGTDLKTVERVLSRKTWGTVLTQGAVQGVSTALILFLLLWVFTPGVSIFSLLLTALAISIGVSVVFAAIAYALSRGERDFNSVQQTVATRYEILCEHKVAQEARDVLVRQPGVAQTQF
mgnify:CR=1 FL=1